MAAFRADSALRNQDLHQCEKQRSRQIYSDFLDLSDYHDLRYFMIINIGNYNGAGVLSEYDNYIMAIIPGVSFFALLLFYFIWKAHYAGEIDAEEDDNSVVKPEKFCVEIEGIDIEKVDEREL